MKKIFAVLIFIVTMAYAQSQPSTVIQYGQGTLTTNEVDTINITGFSFFLRISIGVSDTALYSWSSAAVTTNYAEQYSNEGYTSSFLSNTGHTKLFIRKPTAVSKTVKYRYWLEGR